MSQSKFSFIGRNIAGGLWCTVNACARPIMSLRAKRLPCPVISVGNIVAGGVGKTEVASLISRRLIQEGKRVTVAMRGYGSSWEKKGGVSNQYQEAKIQNFPDEALLHLLKSPGVSVCVGADRYQVLLKNWTQLKPDVVILDDGFQHFALQRDLDVLVHDFSQPHQVKRDFFSQISRAAVKISLSDVPEMESQTHQWILGKYELKGLKNELNARPTSFPKAVFVVCGIGNPERIEKHLNRLGVRVGAMLALSDHVCYDQSTMQTVKHWYESQKEVLPLVTTLKDFVKWDSALLSVSYIDLELTLMKNSDILWNEIKHAISGEAL